MIAKGSNPSPADFTYTFGSIVPDWNPMDEISWANITVSGARAGCAGVRGQSLENVCCDKKKKKEKKEEKEKKKNIA